MFSVWIYGDKLLHPFFFSKLLSIIALTVQYFAIILIVFVKMPINFNPLNESVDNLSRLLSRESGRDGLNLLR